MADNIDSVANRSHPHPSLPVPTCDSPQCDAAFFDLIFWEVRLTSLVTCFSLSCGFYVWCTQSKSKCKSSTLVPSLIESYGMFLLMNSRALWVRKSWRYSVIIAIRHNGHIKRITNRYCAEADRQRYNFSLKTNMCMVCVTLTLINESTCSDTKPPICAWSLILNFVSLTSTVVTLYCTYNMYCRYTQVVNIRKHSSFFSTECVSTWMTMCMRFSKNVSRCWGWYGLYQSCRLGSLKTGQEEGVGE